MLSLAIPADVDRERIEFKLGTIPGVLEVHSLHVWALTIDRNALTVHLTVGESIFVLLDLQGYGQSMYENDVSHWENKKAL